ncbi:MAG TPA: AAA domain-containing protein [Streptosporangiaceae bacterium]
MTERAGITEAGPGGSGDDGQDDAGEAEQPDTRRAELVAAAQEQWVAALTDLGGRNTLLYYKDRRSGTLDLAAADPDVVDRWLRTGSVRLTRLFHDVDVRADAIRRMQVIYRKARELTEERGLAASYLATGMARWDELFLEPAAPVLLRPLTISPTRARHDDFDLVLDEASEVNPVLLHKLATQYGADTEGLAGQATDPDRLARQLRALAAAADIPGFDIRGRRVIGTFTYAKLPMVRDLQNATELLAESDVVAAIAGDPHAQAVIAASDEPDLRLDAIPPADDYSILDADSSQRNAINAVVHGRSLVIHGPPGTGKSQTIANLIATLVARGRKVLFVAEKRAAIDAVLTRLKNTDLGEVVLDIHDGTRDRQRIAADLGAALDRAGQTPEPKVDGLFRRLVDRQQRLTEHVSALHRVHQPWGITPYAAQSALLGVPPEARTPVRLPDTERLTAETAERLRDELREYAHLGGFGFSRLSTPWYGADITTAAHARDALAILARLTGETYPAARERIERANAQAGLRPLASYEDWGPRLALFQGVLATWQRLSPQVFTSDPARLAAATAPRGAGSADLPATATSPALGWRERRSLARQAGALWVSGQPADGELHQALAEAASQLASWEQLRVDGSPPRVPDGLAEAVNVYHDCDQLLNRLRGFVPVPGDAGPLLAELSHDLDVPWRLPRLYELKGGFAQAGLGPLLDWLAGQDPTPDLAAQAFDYAWYSSFLEHVRVRDSRYAAYPGDALDEIADDFRRHDTEHLVANRARVRRAVADRLRVAQEQHPLQARVVRKQAALRRRHMPLRRLLDQASDVLFAAKPCWAMSPLMVSQVLPASRLFDVVIFDEASQVTPADAVPSIMRAHQVIVAGDDRQLPPTNFFRQVSDGETDPDADEDGPLDDDSLVSFGSGFESILDTLRPLLPTSPLTWHYRSRDERLVAFSNARIYDGALTTFPGVIRDDCLRHVVVSQHPTAADGDAAVASEAEAVVGLVLAHARQLPDASLGVIALGIRHADRIDEMLRLALADHPELEGFFAEDRPEPFFVKNLERVQGDERDSIILSIGYGKHPDGRMRYHWGPLLRNGGERRLNVAVTRARHRLTLVSSFSSRDVDPDRVTSAGARLLCEYLEYTDAGGEVAGGPAPQQTGLSPFEADVAQRLDELGISVVPRFGVGGYRVDFAAAHPDEPGRMVLAIEADGASYRDSRSARDRDRLRKEHLERLGWTFHRIWSTNWFHDPESEVAKVQHAYEEAVSRTGPADEFAPPPGPDPGTWASGDAGAEPAAAHGPEPRDGAGGGPVAAPLPLAGADPLAASLPPGDWPVPRALPPGQALAVREPASPQARRAAGDIDPA